MNRKNKKMSHRESARLHFIRRCRERHGLKLTFKEYNQILSAIRSKPTIKNVRADFSKGLNSRSHLYRVTFDQTSMYVIYDIALNELTTALPKNPREIQHYVL